MMRWFLSNDAKIIYDSLDKGDWKYSGGEVYQQQKKDGPYLSIIHGRGPFFTQAEYCDYKNGKITGIIGPLDRWIVYFKIKRILKTIRKQKLYDVLQELK